MGALWMLFTFSVLLLGGNDAAGPARRSAETVRKVAGVVTRKKGMVLSVTDSQRTGTLQGLKNKPKDSIGTGIHPSGQPVKPVGSPGKHIFSKGKQQLKPVTDETEQPVISELSKCSESHYWHPIMKRCKACLLGGHWCIGNSSCCCPGVKQVGSYCKGVPCEDGSEKHQCTCTKDSDCVEGSCCGVTGCGKCGPDNTTFVQGNHVGPIQGHIKNWTRPTSRPNSKFCPRESDRLNSPNRSCCASSSDCSKHECCTFKKNRCFGVCKTNCEGKMLSPPDGCPPSPSPEPDRPLRKRCKTAEECGKHYCCVRNSSRPKAKGWCKPCDATASPTMDLSPTMNVIQFLKKYGFLNCSGDALCPKEMHCVAGQCEFLSCPVPGPPVVSLQEYEDNCCKNKHCGQGSCCRVLQSKAVAVCSSCPGHLKGRSHTPNSCQESSNCPAGSCCVELVRGQGKVCSTCADPAAGLQTREPNGGFDTSSPKRKPNVCKVDFDCAKGRCCILKGAKWTCKRCPIVQPDSQNLGCAVNEDCPDGHCCSDISNSPSGQGMCRPCVTSSHAIPLTQQTQATNGPVKKPPCITNDDCAPVNGTTFCCVSDPLEERKYCLPYRKKNTICTVGDLPQFSCPCEAGLTCLPVAVQETDLMGLGVCSVDQEGDAKASKKDHRAEQKKKIAEERRKQREVRKREKALKKVSN